MYVMQMFFPQSETGQMTPVSIYTKEFPSVFRDPSVLASS